VIYYLVKSAGWRVPGWFTRGEAPWGGEDVWENNVGGLMPVSDNDEILKEVEADYFEDLDWSGTYLDDPSQDAGWLDRGGRFSGCESMLHDSAAELLHKSSTRELEDRGWVRICAAPGGGGAISGWMDWACRKRLSAEQRNWLLRKGYTVDDSE